MFVPFRILAVAKAAAKTISRYAINGVYFERTGDTARAVATDGHRLLTCTWSEESPKQSKFPWNGKSEKKKGFSAVIPTRAIKSAGRMAATRGESSLGGFMIEENITGGKVAIHSADLDCIDGHIQCTINAGTFPPYKDVIPEYANIFKESDADRKKVQAVRIGVNARYMAEMLLALAELCPSENSVVTLIVPAKPTMPIKITAEGSGASALAILMPINLP